MIDSIERGMIKTRSGLFVPRRGYSAVSLQSSVDWLNGYTSGLKIERDMVTAVPRLPAWGTNKADLVYQAVAVGNVENVGTAPTPDPLLASLVADLINEGSVADVVTEAKERTVRGISRVLAVANDSDLGVTGFLRHYLFNYYVCNLGSPIDLVGATYWPLERWQENGLTAVPVDSDDPEKASRFYLEAPQAVVRRNLNRVSFRVADVLMLMPSGNAEWPYWLVKRLEEPAGRFVQVLCHKSHIFPMVNSFSPVPGVGSSSVHRYMGHFANEVLLPLEGFIEQNVATPADGVVIFAGEQFHGIQERLIEMDADKREAGQKIRQGYHIIETADTNAKAVKVSWREFTERDHDRNNVVLVRCFGESVYKYFPLKGVGFSGQSREGVEAAAGTGVIVPLRQFGNFLQYLFPYSTSTVSLPNARQDKTVLENLKLAADALEKLPYTDAQKLAIVEKHASVMTPAVEDEIGDEEE